MFLLFSPNQLPFSFVMRWLCTWLTASETFCRPVCQFMYRSFFLALINCQFPGLYQSVSVSLSIFLFVSTSSAQILQWGRETHRELHRQNSPVFIRDVFHFFFSTASSRRVTTSRFFIFPQTDCTILPVIRTLFVTYSSGVWGSEMEFYVVCSRLNPAR